MTIGITFLIIFLPIIAYFIAANFAACYALFSSAVTYISNLTSVGSGMYNILPSYLTELIIATLILTLSYSIMRRIIS